MISSGKKDTIILSELLKKVSEIDITTYYLGVTKIPCVIKSPIRKDNKPSLGLYSLDGVHVYYKDYATQDYGGILELLGKMWGTTFTDTLERIDKELNTHSKSTISKLNTIQKPIVSTINDSKLDVTIREWRQYDLDYWNSYGITKEWLEWAEVYPVSHKIITNSFGKKYIFGTDKYAYAFIEHKEGNVSIKLYQPFNTSGYKWANKHDRSVISLWNKIPEYGDKVCICSSLKDALCLSANTYIPALAIQGEGYSISNTALSELKRRFKQQFIILDNDPPGLADAIKLQQLTNFTNIVLPKIEGNNELPNPKDISDYYKVLGKTNFINLITNLFKINYNGKS